MSELSGRKFEGDRFAATVCVVSTRAADTVRATVIDKHAPTSKLLHPTFNMSNMTNFFLISYY